MRAKSQAEVRALLLQALGASGTGFEIEFRGPREVKPSAGELESMMRAAKFSQAAIGTAVSAVQVHERLMNAQRYSLRLNGRSFLEATYEDLKQYQRLISDASAAQLVPAALRATVSSYVPKRLQELTSQIQAYKVNLDNTRATEAANNAQLYNKAAALLQGLQQLRAWVDSVGGCTHVGSGRHSRIENMIGFNSCKGRICGWGGKLQEAMNSQKRDPKQIAGLVQKVSEYAVSGWEADPSRFALSRF